MQCFSLSSRLKKEFPEWDIEIFDYTSKAALQAYELALKNVKKPLRTKLQQRNDAFLPCQDQLPLSPQKIISDEFTDAVKYMNDNYDAVIVGSDAVWNWVLRGFPNIYFLKDYHGLKFSYAASAHGMIYQKMTDDQKNYLAEALSDFTYIGVRDRTTEDMVHYVSPELTVHHNCDPTMFLDLKDIPCDKGVLKEKMQKHGVDFSKPLVGMMARRNIGREIRRKYNNKIQLVSVYEPNPFADVYLFDLTPYEWAHVFSFFSATVTHFFHGTMLSLVNETPVIPIETVNDFSSKNVTKIKDLMLRIDLMEWYREVDYRNDSKWQRALRKFGFIQDHKLWNGIFGLLDDFLSGDYTALIAEKREKEAMSFSSLISELKKSTQRRVKK